MEVRNFASRSIGPKPYNSKLIWTKITITTILDSVLLESVSPQVWEVVHSFWPSQVSGESTRLPRLGIRERWHSPLRMPSCTTIQP